MGREVARHIVAYIFEGVFKYRNGCKQPLISGLPSVETMSLVTVLLIAKVITYLGNEAKRSLKVGYVIMVDVLVSHKPSLH